jgi:membrane-bound lytic murein transglycosylase B
LAELENQISQYETTIEQYKTQGKTLQGEIKRLETQIAKLNLQIRAVNLSLNKLDAEIKSTQTQINQTESDIDFNKKNLSQTLQTLYENDSKNLVEILFKNPQLSDFFTDLNNLLAVQDNLRLVIQKIAEAHQKLVDQKEVLALERVDATALKVYQDSQKVNIQKTQTEKSNLLKVTKGKESEYQKLLTETKKTAAEIRKQIFKLLGGGELEFGDAYQLAKFAEQATGVRAALILAVLDRESALGKNVGQCDYKTAMHPTRDIPVFLAIIEKLGFEKNIDSGVIKVSCANTDGAYGGAMGPAQFIPSTWACYGGYVNSASGNCSVNKNGSWSYNSSKDRIGALTGNNPSSPWSNADAFIATALYLKDAGAGAGASLSKEREAAARYYAGSRWRSYLLTYGARVISAAQRFEEDIAILNS